MNGEEDRPNQLACWIHETGYYQCPNSRSEFDLAEYDPSFNEAQEEMLIDGQGI